jgi:hypothetical protein
VVSVKRAVFDFSALERLDSTDALTLQKLQSRLDVSDVSVEITEINDDHRPSLE